MKAKILFLLVLNITILFGSCQKEPVAPGPKPIELNQKSKSLLESNNAFAFEIFREIVETEGNSKNIMISPLSISLALAMTYNGAVGETKEAMENVLHLNGLSIDDINKSYQSLINALLSVDPKVIMEIAFSDLADFSKINPDYDLLISSVKHKTFIEVNEEGTEAAAVTAVTVGTTSIGPSSEFRADHPFIFIIKEKYTGAIMFMGKIAVPETGS